MLILKGLIYFGIKTTHASQEYTFERAQYQEINDNLPYESDLPAEN